MVMMRIDIDEINSSNIEGFTFFAEQENDTFTNHTSVVGTLLVEYSTGDVYKFFNIPFGLFTNIISSQSVGSAANKMLKGFKYEKVVFIDAVKKTQS